MASRRDVSFLRSVGRTPIGTLLWPEGTVALVLGGGGGTALLAALSVEERTTVVGDGLTILSVLLGVVFTAFALLIALLSDNYVRLLQKVDGGIIVFLRPFMIAVGCQVTAIVVSMAYRATAGDLDSRIEVGLFLAWAVLFTFVISDVVALTRNVMLHGLTRAELAEIPDDGGNVRPLRDKAGP